MIYPIILHHDKSVEYTKSLEANLFGREYDIIDSSALHTSFTQSFNIACIKAYTHFLANKYTHVMICNNDISLNSSQLDILDQKIGNMDGIFTPSANSPHHSVMSAVGSDDLREVPWIEFICPIISFSVIDTIGLLDTKLLHGWGVELDYCYRASLQNFKTYLVQNVIVHHYEHRSQDNHNNYRHHANSEMNHVLRGKYGDGWQEILKYPQW